MNTGELLQELRENILHDRSDRVAGSSDYLWTDATLVRYMNEAQRRFARKSLILRDSTTVEVCQVTLVAGQSEYTLHPSVLAVLSAKLDDDTGDLTRAGHTAFSTYVRADTTFYDPSVFATLSPGRPIAYSTDETFGVDDHDSRGVVVLRAYPAPTTEYAGNIINLRVIRLPVEALTPARLKATPEIPEDHHLEMLDWAAYLALRIVDVDAGMPKQAEEFRKSFEGHVRAARDSVLRKMFVPLPWGFGRGGWVWGN